jgi:hypothetical protein
MSNAKHKKLSIFAAAAGAIALAGTALATSWAGVAQATPASPAHHEQAHLRLTPMPEGWVTLGRDDANDVTASVNLFGLTPGSSHAAELVSVDGTVVAQFGSLTANGAGQAQATLDSGFNGALTPWLRFELLNGTAGDPVSVERIAETSWLGWGVPTYPLIPVEVAADGARFGVPFGRATVSYSPAAKAITVTVTAGGLTPGPHAAHIHVGSCQSQGPVLYMLMDFTANAEGFINHETRVVTGVTTPLPSTGLYLNLHQGDSSNILANGNPTINFRPLLCANIVTNG